MWNTKTMLSRYKYKTQWMNAIRKQKGWTEEIESGIDFAKGIPILFFKCLWFLSEEKETCIKISLLVFPTISTQQTPNKSELASHG